MELLNVRRHCQHELGQLRALALKASKGKHLKEILQTHSSCYEGR